MDVLRKLPSLMLMTEKVSYNGENGSEGLHWDVPFRADYLIRLVAALHGV